MIRERARAKVNLTLKVLGRRSDGYHELESLVAFASVADEVSLDVAKASSVSVHGPFGETIAGENLLNVTLEKLRDAEPRLRLGAVSLEKNLPVAAGVGGGSADAAALLRAVRAANSEFRDRFDWPAFAQSLGADVPVCFADQAAIMRGTGERLEPLPSLAPLNAVLVNPRVAVPADKTARVFRTLAAPALVEAKASAVTLNDRNDLLSHIRGVSNDLTLAAVKVVPEIGTVLNALTSCPAIEYAALSGGGPTCFAIFPDKARAESAAQQLTQAFPQWWVVTTTLS